MERTKKPRPAYPAYRKAGGQAGTAVEWGKLTKAVITKLEAAGYAGLQDLKGMDLKALEGIEGIGKVSAEKILKELS